MATYVVSDLHSCFTKFIKTVPPDTERLIILGDCFNKGREQEQMFDWVMKNANNPRYVFVRGNTEVRLHNELIRHFSPRSTSMYYDWLGTHTGYANKNISNVVIDLIERQKKYSFDDVMNVLRNRFVWFHIEDDWIMAHASWDIYKSPGNQNKVNLVYDTHKNLAKFRKIDYDLKVPKMYKDYKFILGHTPVYHIQANAMPPVILRNKFFYIDNGIFKTERPMFYMRIK
jgi:hypothetical protein